MVDLTRHENLPPRGNVTGSWKVPGNPGPTRSESGEFELTFWAVNVSEGPATRAFSAVVLKENGRPLSTLDCETGPAVPSGEIVLVDCVTTDDFETGWRGVRIQAAN